MLSSRLSSTYVGEDFHARIPPFDSPAAEACAAITAERRSAGRPIGQLDYRIAAIGRARGAAVATRNAKDFERCGIEVIDPWSQGGAGRMSVARRGNAPATHLAFVA